ncbi:transcriptional regulator [Gordoniibacillus kamchatkensis]|uniref:Transcriptional regulator n=1 Tax=Gordoniibacillus kamchatkensis TaxID=1590651 RepID=A0ABR5A956_9BACL|nr:Lrp/AsnC family transcriptional regulator [Paenibacillus sp. VKM B-2647]KIL37135.1 transcriptional regulator [Paenibacillus sp. VKM B-2647]
MQYELDPTDIAILRLLQSNARLQWREIGEQVHLTGQAVGVRIRRLEELGAIRGYTVLTDEAKLGKPITAIVTILMKTNLHAEFQRFLREEETVREAHRISGDGCYSLKALAADNDELNRLLDRILEFANYRVQLSIQQVK